MFLSSCVFVHIKAVNEQAIFAPGFVNHTGMQPVIDQTWSETFTIVFAKFVLLYCYIAILLYCFIALLLYLGEKLMES